jgi:hypothetical protein
MLAIFEAPLLYGGERRLELCRQSLRVTNPNDSALFAISRQTPIPGGQFGWRQSRDGNSPYGSTGPVHIGASVRTETSVAFGGCHLIMSKNPCRNALVCPRHPLGSSKSGIICDRPISSRPKAGNERLSTRSSCCRHRGRRLSERRRGTKTVPAGVDEWRDRSHALPSRLPSRTNMGSSQFRRQRRRQLERVDRCLAMTGNVRSSDRMSASS